jgi:hypothetical protein
MQRLSDGAPLAPRKAVMRDFPSTSAVDLKIPPVRRQNRKEIQIKRMHSTLMSWRA